MSSMQTAAANLMHEQEAVPLTDACTFMLSKSSCRQRVLLKSTASLAS
jgi:hypothetical protein